MSRVHHNSWPNSSMNPMITLIVDEHDGRTYAKVELKWGSAQLAGLGVAYRHPADCLWREAGEELATARALLDLSERITALWRCTARSTHTASRSG